MGSSSIHAGVPRQLHHCGCILSRIWRNIEPLLHIGHLCHSQLSYVAVLKRADLCVSLFKVDLLLYSLEREVVPIPPFVESLGLGIACAPVSASGQVPFEFLVFMVNQAGAIVCSIVQNCILRTHFAVVAILTLYRGMRQYRVSHNPMIKTMFQDGENQTSRFRHTWNSWRIRVVVLCLHAKLVRFSIIYGCTRTKSISSFHC